VPLRLIGAGLGRTGTSSLQQAVEQLTGGRCYHMVELFGNREATETWHRAVRGEMPDWEVFLAGYDATLDWPACRFWRELADAFPRAPVLLSTRSSPEVWWASMEKTVARAMAGPTLDEQHARQRAMVRELLDEHLGADWRDGPGAIAAYQRHNADVRAGVDPGRLVEWQPGDGWEPLCRALDVPVPGEPFPHRNTSADFQEMLDDQAARVEQQQQAGGDG
jgi:hypothetical protein